MHRKHEMFISSLTFPIIQIRLKPAVHDTTDATMQELTHQYVMINCVEGFR